MPCEIHERDGYFEVRVPTGATMFDLLKTVGELSQRDQTKRLCDLWLFEKDVQLSYNLFAGTAQAIQRLCPPGMKGNRTAIVAADAFQQAQLELYRAEATRLPFEIRVFSDQATALRWLTNQPTPTI